MVRSFAEDFRSNLNLPLISFTTGCSKMRGDRARELHDGNILVGLLNAQSAVAVEDNCTWETRDGGFFQVLPATAAVGGHGGPCLSGDL